MVFQLQQPSADTASERNCLVKYKLI